MNTKILLLGALCVCAGGAWAVEFRDDFTVAREGRFPEERWFSQGAWSVQKGALECGDVRRAFAIPVDVPYGREVRVEATVVPQAATGTDWKMAGVAVYQDAKNYWLFCVTEFPDKMGAGKHLIELNAMVDGVWQAQRLEGAETRLEEWSPLQGGTWRSGEAIRMKLVLSEEGVRAMMTDANGQRVYESGYRFVPGRRMVTSGVPLLWSQAYRTRFDDVVVSVEERVATPEGALNVRTPIPEPKVPEEGASWIHVADFDATKEEAAVEAPWMATSRYWETRRKALRAADPGRTVATVEGAPSGRELRLEAEVMVEQSLGGSWKQAGLAITEKQDRYWLLCMTEEPGNHAGAKHLFELSEMLSKNQWQAQNREGPTKLEAVEVRTFQPWSKGVRYRMRLELNEELIEGTVFGPHGEILFHALYRIRAEMDDAQVVRSGSPILWNQGLDASFDAVKFVVHEAEREAQTPWPQVRPRVDETPYPARPYTAKPMGEKLVDEAPGYFRVQTQEGGTAWFVDPNGHRYLSIGVEQVKYSGHFSPHLGYSPYNRTIQEKFGGYIQKWAESTSGRLREWGFNTASVMPYAVAPGGGEAFLDGIAVTLIVNLGKEFVAYSDLSPITINGFPNVFHPRWQEHCDAKAREFCARFRNNPWILGYYIDNELDWHGSNCAAFFIHTSGNGPLEYGLILDILRKPADHSARIAWLDFLRKRYDSIAALNRAWGTEFASFEEIDAERTFVFGDPVPGAIPDARAFLRVIADRYYGATSAAIRKADPNHLILGTRFAGWSQDPVWEMCGRYCDVVSVNHYPFVELEEGTVNSAREMLHHVVTLCKKPILLSEWSFVSLDSGLPCRHGAGERFDTLEQRARAFQIYQSMLFETPFCVGSDYFMWVDQPSGGMGSASNPEDCSYGLVNEKDEPYELLVKTATTINHAAIELHEGAVPRLEFTEDALVVENRDRQARHYNIELWENGVQREHSSRTVKSGSTGQFPLDSKENRFAQARARVSDFGVCMPELVKMGGKDVVMHVKRGYKGLPETDGQAKWTIDHRVEKGCISIANPTGTKLENVLVEIPLAPSELLRAEALKGKTHPLQQIEEWEDKRTLVVLVQTLPPHDAVVYRLEPNPTAQVLKPSPISLPFRLDNNRLQVVKLHPNGMLLDTIALDGTPLGALHPLLWQKTPQNQFVKPSQLLSLTGIVGPVRTTLDYDLVLADASAAERIPEVSREGKPIAPVGIASNVGAFRTRYRVVIPAESPIFTTQFRGAQNLADFAWSLDRYYHYMPSRLGGSEMMDRPLSSTDVTEYYNPSLLWFDDEARAGYGVVRPRNFFGSSFRIDPDGTQHPDLCRIVRLRLEPGEAWWTESEPALPLFGCRGNASAAPWEAVTKDLMARQSILIQR